MSMFTCIQQLRGGSTKLHHIIANFAFAAYKSITKPKLYNTYATISVNNSTTSNLGSVYQFIAQNLPHEHA